MVDGFIGSQVKNWSGCVWHNYVRWKMIQASGHYTLRENKFWLLKKSHSNIYTDCNKLYTHQIGHNYNNLISLGNKRTLVLQWWGHKEK